MNTKILVAAIAAMSSTAAFAQSNVQIYGLLDAGVEYVTNATAAGNSVTRVTSGGSNNSRLGFRGTEDLGGGLKAVWNLEAGILVDQGASDGALFRRQSNVGLEGQFGRLVIGRSFTTVYDFVNPFDPMGYAPRFSWVPSGNGTLSSKYGMNTAFDNMVKYEGKFGNLKVGGSFGAGEVPGRVADGRKLAVAAGYDLGAWRFVLTAEQVNGTSNAAGLRSVNDVYHAATAFRISKELDLKAGYRNYKLTPATGPDVRADTWWAGANYELTPVDELTGVAYYENVKAGVNAKDTASDPIMFVARIKHSLSKRTFVYLTAAHVKGKGGVPVGVTRDATVDGGVSGFADHQSALMVGFQHRF